MKSNNVQMIYHVIKVGYQGKKVVNQVTVY
jgi:hypothetical protein